MNTYTDGYQYTAYTTNTAKNSSGKFVVAWGSDGWGVYAQRYDSNGDPVSSEFQVNAYTTGSQHN